MKCDQSFVSRYGWIASVVWVGVVLIFVPPVFAQEEKKAVAPDAADSGEAGVAVGHVFRNDAPFSVAWMAAPVASSCATCRVHQQ